MTRRPRPARPSLALAGLLVVLACKQSSPVITGRPPAQIEDGVVRTSGLIAGPTKTRLSLRNPYDGDKNALADGRRYYNWFNCTGCHGAAGGGGIGPPLADQDWIYGGDPANLFLSIVQGRPNGMPSFGETIPDEQVWKIAAYVRSLAGEAGASGATADQNAGGGDEGGETGSVEGRPQDRRADGPGS
jgi:cytochrome c oxidase cbb3-type subunit 3